MTLPLHSSKTSRDGFGMIAVMITILLVGLAAVGIIQLINPALMTRNGRLTVDRMELIKSAVAKYKVNHGGSTQPTSLDHLVTTDGGAACALDNSTTSATYKTLQGWCGPYIDVTFSENSTEFKTDAWGTVFSWTSGTGTLRSCGSNRTCGDSDDITSTI
jgi:hypothetical protein